MTFNQKDQKAKIIEMYHKYVFHTQEDGEKLWRSIESLITKKDKDIVVIDLGIGTGTISLEIINSIDIEKKKIFWLGLEKERSHIDSFIKRAKKKGFSINENKQQKTIILNRCNILIKIKEENIEESKLDFIQNNVVDNSILVFFVPFIFQHLKNGEETLFFLLQQITWQRQAILVLGELKGHWIPYAFPFLCSSYDMFVKEGMNKYLKNLFNKNINKFFYKRLLRNYDAFNINTTLWNLSNKYKIKNINSILIKHDIEVNSNDILFQLNNKIWSFLVFNKDKKQNLNMSLESNSKFTSSHKYYNLLLEKKWN